MGSLVPLRDEMLRGDQRPLYLGWLAGVNAGKVGERAAEPDVPPGLAELSTAQQALVEFLEIDPDLLAAAATASQSLDDVWCDDDSIEVWATEWRRGEIETMLRMLVLGAPHEAERWAKSAFLAWLEESGTRESTPATPRTVAALRALAKEAQTRRLGREAKEHAHMEAEHRKQRDAYLRMLASEFDRHWKAVEQQVARGTGAAYEAATRALVDLADAYALVKDRAAFDYALRRWMERHARRSALVRRPAPAQGPP
jgi:hypothetical protein